MSDISNQSQIMNGMLKEKKLDKIKSQSSKLDKEIEDRAMYLYDKVVDVFSKENATMEEIYILCTALAESIYYYSLFGED